MLELLFLVGFAFVLMFTGITMVGMIAALAVGFIVMALAGMIGMVFKLLPWIIVIGVGIWFFKNKVNQPRYRD
ncbi:envelope stress response protein PspG [Vibrio sp. Of7-15]|uniref:envelope stress response protein PspG n=1 Tax=Vibrio sp. Of7-15 TaxID=2724879 RepID=UPI001EF2EAF6|nr:envelope stress response protein PspG [Vibrio sp. Of7-15]MCG7498741.1 envelope stress response protein PspG [Vibrio sp. Of7-15]